MSSSETASVQSFPEMMEKTLSSELIYQGKVIEVRRDMAELPNGRTAVRDVTRHPGGVVVLPILENGDLVFVEQYRYPLGRTLLELPAGKLEPNEDPAEAIRRELQEETGYLADHWEALSTVYTAPGFCDEKLWLYRATGLREAPLSPEARSAADIQDEFIRVHRLTQEEAIRAARQGDILDAKTVCLLFWLLSP